MAERWPPTPADVYRDVGRWYPWYAKRGGRWPPGVNVPLIADDAGSVAHVWNPDPGTGLVDIFGNSWTQNGTVPLVPRDGLVPAGFGPFSDANYFSLGSGNDILDFSGDFSACFVYVVVEGASGPVLFGNGEVNVEGYYYQHYANSNGARVVFNTGGGASAIIDPVAPVSGVNVLCGGRAGSTGHLKLNLRSEITGAAGVKTPGVTRQARLSRYASTGYALSGILYEAWFSTTTPSDALFTAIAQSIKTKLGITAW